MSTARTGNDDMNGPSKPIGTEDDIYSTILEDMVTARNQVENVLGEPHLEIIAAYMNSLSMHRSVGAIEKSIGELHGVLQNTYLATQAIADRMANQ